MNAKEKAFQLFCKFYRDNDLLVEDLSRIQAKECALICCDEVLGYMGADRGYEFWTEVKQEIKNL